jgi:predicted amino acid-binding ACT domain protein
MMRAPNKWAVAVRRPDGVIEAASHDLPRLSSRSRWARVPFVRGVLVLGESLSLGFRALSWSAQKAGEEEGVELKRREIVLSMVLALAFFVAIFMLVPLAVAKGMERLHIPIRVKNAFEPDHPGTLISHDYRSPTPRVEMITGRRDTVAVEVVDPDMVGQSGYDHRLLSHFANHKISYIAKNTNANTITHYVPAKAKNLDRCLADIRAAHPGADVRTVPMTIVSVIGSNMNVPGFLAKAAGALAQADINILAMGQCMRQVNMQFIIRDEDFENAIIALHRALVEN